VHDPEHISRVQKRFLRGDFGRDPTRNGVTEGALRRMREREDDVYGDGYRMVEVNVPERLSSVVRRACRSSVFSRRVLVAFERELVGCLSPPSDDDDDVDDGVDVGGSSLAPDGNEAVLKEVLVQMPLVTRKGNRATIRFLFENGNHGAFNRILLHGVGRFHGLNTVSTTTERGFRLLTVTGVCRGGGLRMVDFLGLEEEEEEGLGATGLDMVVVNSVSSVKVS